MELTFERARQIENTYTDEWTVDFQIVLQAIKMVSQAFVKENDWGVVK